MRTPNFLIYVVCFAVGFLVAHGCAVLIRRDPEELARDRHMRNVEAAFRRGELR